jgi:hypothetical protein
LRIYADYCLLNIAAEWSYPPGEDGAVLKSVDAIMWEVDLAELWGAVDFINVYYL